MHVQCSDFEPIFVKGEGNIRSISNPILNNNFSPLDIILCMLNQKDVCRQEVSSDLGLSFQVKGQGHNRSLGYMDPNFSPLGIVCLYYTVLNSSITCQIEHEQCSLITKFLSQWFKVKAKFSNMLLILIPLIKIGCFEVITISMNFSFKTVYPYPLEKLTPTLIENNKILHKFVKSREKNFLIHKY